MRVDLDSIQPEMMKDKLLRLGQCWQKGVKTNKQIQWIKNVILKKKSNWHYRTKEF